ncbi:MAG: lamin tail domain-containing protein, partial [Candidatus Neomarinimicrobiota bacterium]|nr:lamin tail domain-containing protein [Candidatus Neomarinimicrobiota bacterium]
MYIKYFIIICYVVVNSVLSQSNHTILTYNLLNYDDEDDREPHYQLIINEIQPDIIVCQEVNADNGFNHFLSDILNIAQPDEWMGAEFTNQSASQDIGLYYKPQYFNYISTSVINTAQGSGTRNVVEWVLEHVESSVQFRVYGVHLKASSGQSNAQERLAETTILRNYLNNLSSGIHFIVCGDFNIYSNSSTSEPAFDMLTVAGDNASGQLFDPINRIGNWHNNSSFSDVHTQSPRTTQFGGGANGGMDDRFDWIFASSAVMEESYEMTYVENSYIVLGNDGAHFNQAINSGTNSAVSEEMADALHAASDHLPVFADFQFPSGDESDYHVVITEVMPNPSAVSDSYGEWFEIFNLDSLTINLNGWIIRDEGSDSHIINSTIEIQPGEYMVLGRNGNESVNGGYVSDYTYSAFALANSNDEIILLDQDEKVVDNVSY